LSPTTDAAILKQWCLSVFNLGKLNAVAIRYLSLDVEVLKPLKLRKFSVPIYSTVLDENY
jgi:hypothetical protein